MNAPAPVFAVNGQFPEPMEWLFRPKRYKVFWGGRGAGRSWGVARALLLIGTKKPTRVLCARELQNSITESVHKVLTDQIEALGLSSFYDVQAQKIIGKNGTTFSFEGIKNNTSKIRSYEGIDYCWVEEAVKVSKSSWGVLIPTIRKAGSEIWMTFNPELETDYTYTRFVQDPDLKPLSPRIAESGRAVVVKMTWEDNPWFPEELREEMEYDRAHDYDHYLNVWGGFCVQNLEGAIYAKQLRRAQEEGRICRVPYCPEVAVETFWDLGRADSTAIWCVQQVAQQYRVVNYIEDSFQDDVSYYVKELRKLNYVLGTVHLPHDAKAKKLGMKRTIQEQIKGYGFDTRIVPKQSVSDGINAVRLVFGRCWFDEQNTKEGISALRNYRYRITDGQLSNDPLHDWASDGADAFRTFAMGIRAERDVGGTVVERLRRMARTRSRREPVANGWMR